MTHPWWPVADLRLRDGDGLVLRPMTEADLGPLADLLPLDVEMDPSLPAFAVEDPRVARSIAQAQEYWRRLGTWRRESWNLPFVVVRDGALLGVQSLEAEGFAERRTVDSSSWLATQARGRGIGKAMRRAVLALAFDGLAAEFAETSAWSDNAASLGVSRSLGYVDNGVHRQASPGRVDDMVHLRMTRKTWLARHTDHGVHIEGLSGCQQFFS